MSEVSKEPGVIAMLALTAAVLAIASTPARARENELTFHLRSYYLDRERPNAADFNASAIGGWLGYDSGWFADRVRFGLVAYTSQKLDGPLDQDGTLLLKPDQKSYGGLGELFARVKLWDGHAFTAYRQQVFQPEVNPQDNRMTPNTFEGYTFDGKLAGVNYYGGYLDKMKPRNATGFVDMALIAGSTTTARSGMWLGGLSYAPQKNLALRLSAFHVPDILTSTYADVAWTTPLSETWTLRLGGQTMFQSSTGDNALTGASFDTWSGGVRADFLRASATLRTGYTQTGRGANYRSPYGTWAGYTSMAVTDFNRARENAFLLEGSYDFAAMKVPGLAVTAYGAFGGRAVNPATGAAASDKTEYNATFDYRFATGAWPDWIKPLWIRARVTRLEEELNSVTSITKDYRLIVNYEQTLKW